MPHSHQLTQLQRSSSGAGDQDGLFSSAMDAGSTLTPDWIQSSNDYNNLTSLGFDNQPMTIAEAVSRERGVLYCDPKLREGLEHAGFLSESPDESGIADALVALVSDPELLLDLSRGAAIDRTAFAPQSYVQRIRDVYQG